ncbi:MAG: hypothetical protein HY817_01890 [Candidatus Abawacabacteria bacterium]|nr:hypothetical protein [Candidatus Abawacabacteria bacterium]
MLNLWVLLFSAILGWSTLWLVISRLTPCELLIDQVCTTGIEWGGVFAFFVALFIALSATFAMVIFFLHRFFSGNEIFYAFLVVALRQGVLLSTGLCLLLLLKALQVFFWWDGLIIILVMVLIELAFHRKPLSP